MSRTTAVDIYARTPSGDEFDWGEITEWNEPERLSYLWHLGTERLRATHVVIDFHRALRELNGRGSAG